MYYYSATYYASFCQFAYLLLLHKTLSSFWLWRPDKLVCSLNLPAPELTPEDRDERPGAVVCVWAESGPGLERGAAAWAALAWRWRPRSIFRWRDPLTRVTITSWPQHSQHLTWDRAPPSSGGRWRSWPWPASAWPSPPTSSPGHRQRFTARTEPGESGDAVFSIQQRQLKH